MPKDEKAFFEAAKRVIDGTPNYVDIAQTTFVVWGRTGVGFGEAVFFKDDDGVLKCENEGMSKEFIKEVLCDLVDKAEFQDVRPE